MDSFELILKRLQRRLTVFLWIRHASLALVWGMVASCFWLILTRFFPVLGDPVPVVAAILALSVIGATVYTWMKRPNTLNAALAADEVLGLQERLTSSLELADGKGEMVEALHRDARNHVGKLDMGRDFPVRAPRSLRWLLAPLAVYLIAFLFLPEFDLFGHEEAVRQAEAAAQARRVQAERLRNAARPLRDPALENNEVFESLAEGIDRIALGVEAGEITEKQAVARLAKLEESLAAERDKLGEDVSFAKQGGKRANLDMTRNLASALENGNLDQAMQEMGEIMEKMQSGEMTPEDTQKLGKELEEISKMLGENSSLGEAMSQLAQQMQNMDMSNSGTAGQQAMQISAEMAEALEQMSTSMGELSEALQQMQMAEAALGECKGGLCKGTKMALGMRGGQGQGKRSNWGLGGPGRGKGNQIGELPDTEASFDPTLLSGEMTRGKVLASIMQRTAPDEDDAESEAEYVSEAFIEVQQQAEEALTQEEIPPGAREIVRQYFGSLEPAREK